MYYEGKGVTKNKQEAAKWYRKVAEQESPYANYARYMLGFMYDYGDGVAKDKQEAIRWYRKAAQGNNYASKKRLQELGAE